MSGTTMMPRFRPGQRLYVNPHRPPSTGAGIIASTVNVDLIVSQYLEDVEDTIHSEQLNPARHFEFRRSDIQALHTVIGLDEF
jgi:phage repressor protein C with HTH and peptisase S24 domain